jgi:hypothetical protein
MFQVRSSFGEVTYMQQRRTHHAMAHYERHSRLLLLGERLVSQSDHNQLRELPNLQRIVALNQGGELK